MRYERKEFTGIAAVGQSNTVKTLDYVDKWLQVSGTFVATLAVQGRIHDSDWITLTTITAATLVEVPQAVREMRIDVTSYTSGTPKAFLAARNARQV